MCISIYMHIILINQIYFCFSNYWLFFPKMCAWHVTFDWGNTRVSNTWFLPSRKKDRQRWYSYMSICMPLTFTGIISVNSLSNTVMLNICNSILFFFHFIIF